MDEIATYEKSKLVCCEAKLIYSIAAILILQKNFIQRSMTTSPSREIIHGRQNFSENMFMEKKSLHLKPFFVKNHESRIVNTLYMQ